MRAALDSDVVLLGTGIAPLIAASRMIAEGKTVLILNPDLDFFLEDSELPLDPFWPMSESVTAERVGKNTLDQAFSELSPYYPGAIEKWPPASQGDRETGYHDPSAPHLRGRSRLWIESSAATIEQVERLYLEADEKNLKPQVLEGIVALSRFPGMTRNLGGAQPAASRGILFPKVSDLDISRYRNGLLEFLRDRLSDERVVLGASQIDFIPEGVRFYSGGSPKTARIREGLLIFWTPRLTQWIQNQAKKNEVIPLQPEGVRVWEQWLLLSRDILEPSVVGSFENMTVWAEIEGTVPDAATASASVEKETGAQDPLLRNLSVLIAGPLVKSDSAKEISWASQDSLKHLSRLCNEFLKWERFSIRGMKPRAIFEWQDPGSFRLFEDGFRAEVICGCDGSVMDIVCNVRKACDEFFSSESEVKTNGENS